MFFLNLLKNLWLRLFIKFLHSYLFLKLLLNTLVYFRVELVSKEDGEPYERRDEKFPTFRAVTGTLTQLLLEPLNLLLLVLKFNCMLDLIYVIFKIPNFSLSYQPGIKIYLQLSVGLSQTINCIFLLIEQCFYSLKVLTGLLFLYPWC